MKEPIYEILEEFQSNQESLPKAVVKQFNSVDISPSVKKKTCYEAVIKEPTICYDLDCNSDLCKSIGYEIVW